MVLRAAAAAKNSKVDIGQGYIYVGLGRLPVPLFSSTMNVRMPLSIVEGIPGQKEAMLQTDTSFFSTGHLSHGGQTAFTRATIERGVTLWDVLKLSLSVEIPSAVPQKLFFLQVCTGPVIGLINAVILDRTKAHAF